MAAKRREGKDFLPGVDVARQNLHSDGMALLLLPHGLLCDQRLWRGQQAAVSAERDATVADPTRDHMIAAMAARPLAAGSRHFAAAALSLGGYVAFEMCREAHGVAAAFRHLGAADTEAPWRRRRRGLIALARSGQCRGVAPRPLLLLLAPADRQPRLDARLAG